MKVSELQLALCTAVEAPSIQCIPSNDRPYQSETMYAAKDDEEKKDTSLKIISNMNLVPKKNFC